MNKIVLIIILAVVVVGGGVGVAYYFDNKDAASSVSMSDDEKERVVSSGDKKIVSEETKKLIKTPPQETTYDIAKKTGDPYLCTYRQSGFFGDFNYYEAQILNNTFYANQIFPNPTGAPVSEAKLFNKYQSARIGDFAYGWVERRSGESSYSFEGGTGGKVSISKILQYLNSIGDKTSNYFSSFLFAHASKSGAIFYYAVPDTAECASIQKITMTLPNLSFPDSTQASIDWYELVSHEQTQEELDQYLKDNPEAAAAYRGTQRKDDILNIRGALLAYYDNKKSYPDTLQQLLSDSEAAQRLENKIPVAPTPADGECTDLQNSYTYKKTEALKYTLSFCMGSDSSIFKKGVNTITETFSF